MDGTAEDTYQCINRLFNPEIEETQSISTENATFPRGAFRRRANPNFDTHWRFDMEVPKGKAMAISKALMEPNYLQAACPAIMAFPLQLSTSFQTFLVSSKRSENIKDPTPPMELINMIANVEGMSELLVYAMARTRFSSIIQLDMEKAPFGENHKKLQWLNGLFQEAGSNIFTHDGNYLLNTREKANNSKQMSNSYIPTSENSIIVECPRSISFRDTRTAVSLFGKVATIFPIDTKSYDLDTSLYYEAIYEDQNSAYLAHEECINGIFMRAAKKNEQKKTSMIENMRTKIKGNKSRWEICLQIGKSLGVQEQLQSYEDQLSIPTINPDTS